MVFLSLLTALLFTSPDEFDYHLKVMTYNIHHAEGTDGKLDIDRIVQIIKDSDADVVCLQEVDQNLSRTDRINMPSVFRRKLGMYGVFGANYHFDDGHYGNLTLSRFPIVHSENIPLPNPNDKEPRGCLRIDIKMPAFRDDPGVGERVFHIFNTHLGLSSDEREAQTKHIVSMLPEKALLVVAGDLNAITDTAEIATLLAVLKDGDISDTKSATIPVENPTRRIDYILHSWPEESNLNTFDIVRTDDTAVASDHLPVVAKLHNRK